MIFEKNQPKSIASVCPMEPEKPKKMEKQIQCSKYFSQYNADMPICTLSIEEINQKLNNAGFQYSQENSFEFNCQMIKINDCSVTYRIEYGYYRHYLHAYISKINIRNLFQRIYVSSGMHAWTQSFTYDEIQIVAKVTKVQNIKQLISDIILKQVFFHKIASVLGIAPKFISIYGYDIVFLKNQVQFLMQRCRSKTIDNIHQANKLKEGLSMLHKLKIQHGDINLSNFLWNDNLQKHVFIDFGLSSFLKQNIGQKSLSSFKGSFQYCSKQMQQAFYKKKPCYIDLYYNDLFGVNKIIQRLGSKNESSQKKPVIKIIGQSTKMKHKKQHKYNNLGDWSQLIGFFKINYLAYFQKYDDILQIVKQQKKIQHSLRVTAKKAINRLKQQKLRQRLLEQLIQIKNNGKSLQQIGQKTLDRNIYVQIMSTNSLLQEHFKQITIFNINKIIQMNIFRSYWEKAHYKTQIFQILFSDSGESHFNEFQIQSKVKQIKNMVIKQIIQQSHLLSSSQLDSYYQTLNIFRSFFQQQKKIKYLEIIVDIFQSLFLVTEVQNTAQIICTIFQEKQKDVLDYLTVAHKFIYRKTFYIDTIGSYWQEKYIDKLLKDKTSINKLDQFFKCLINLENFNKEELNYYLQTTNLLSTDQQIQIFQSCKTIKACNFYNVPEQQLKQIQNSVESNQLYAERAYLSLNHISNQCYCDYNQFYSWRKNYRQMLDALKLVLNVDLLRDTDFILGQNWNKFFQILNDYYNLFNKFKELLNWQNFSAVTHYIQIFMQKIPQDKLQNLIQWNIKFNKLISLAKTSTKNMNYLISIIRKKLNSSIVGSKFTIQKFSQQKDQILNKHKKQQYKMVQKYLEYFHQLKLPQKQLQQILCYKLLLQLFKSDQPLSIYLAMKNIFQFTKIYSIQNHMSLSTQILRFVGISYNSISSNQEQQQQIKKQYTSFFFKSYSLNKRHFLQKFDLALIIRIIYSEQLSEKIFSLLLERGSILKKKHINYSVPSILAVRIFLYLNKFNLQKIDIILKWKLQDVYQNVYKAAFCLNYLKTSFFRNLGKQQIRRIFILSVRAISTVDFGCNQIQQEIMVWNQIRKWIKNKKNKKYRKVLQELVRSWCRYTNREKYLTYLCTDNEKQFIMLREKLRKRKKNYFSNTLKYQIQIIEDKFSKKIKKMRKYLDIKV